MVPNAEIITENEEFNIGRLTVPVPSFPCCAQLLAVPTGGHVVHPKSQAPGDPFARVVL